MKILPLMLLPLSLFADGNPSRVPPGNSQAPATAPNTPAAYVDPVNTYLALYDTNHDGRLDASELKRMAILDPAAYTIASAFVDNRGQLGVDQIAAWRNFLKAKSTQKPAGA